MSDHIGPAVAAEAASRVQRHPYADHPTALVLADHQPRYVTASTKPAAPVRCVSDDWGGAVVRLRRPPDRQARPGGATEGGHVSVPDPLRIIDPAFQASLYFDVDLGATGDGLAIAGSGDGTRLSVALDLDDIRSLHDWAGAVLQACEATQAAT